MKEMAIQSVDQESLMNELLKKLLVVGLCQSVIEHTGTLKTVTDSELRKIVLLMIITAVTQEDQLNTIN